MCKFINNIIYECIIVKYFYYNYYQIFCQQERVLIFKNIKAGI